MNWHEEMLKNSFELYKKDLLDLSNRHQENDFLKMLNLFFEQNPPSLKNIEFESFEDNFKKCGEPIISEIINQQSVGFGNPDGFYLNERKKNIIIVGTEPAYDIDDYGKISSEGIFNTAFWLFDFPADAISKVVSKLNYRGRNNVQFFKNPALYYDVGPGHTWNKAGFVLFGGSDKSKELFEKAYLIDMSCYPSKLAINGRGPTVKRGKFMWNFFNAYGKENDEADKVIIFHGGHENKQFSGYVDYWMKAFFDSRELPNPVICFKDKKKYVVYSTKNSRRVILTVPMNGNAGAKNSYWETIRDEIFKS